LGDVGERNDAQGRAAPGAYRVTKEVAMDLGLEMFLGSAANTAVTGEVIRASGGVS